MANTTALTPVQKLKRSLSAESVQEQFKNALQENAGIFTASLIDIYNNDTYLQKCDPNKVIMEALKAATLKLPINKNLGFAYIVPYGGEPTFTIGYKGLLQLAMRTGQYKFVNADVVYEGELQSIDKLTGEIDLNGEPASSKEIGYFAYIETINGFKKGIYWTHERVLAHAKRYSKSYNSSRSAWKTNFNEMAIKTVLRLLLSHYGIMSVEMISAFTADDVDERTVDAKVEDEINENANQDFIDIDLEIKEENPTNEGPGF